MDRNNQDNKTRDSVISIRGLQKSFDEHEVLKGIDLDLHKGENLVVMGRSDGNAPAWLQSFPWHQFFRTVPAAPAQRYDVARSLAVDKPKLASCR